MFAAQPFFTHSSSAKPRLSGIMLGALFALGALASNVASAQVYIKSDKGCLVHNALPQPNETITWSGECKDGYATGRGIVRWFGSGQVKEIVESDFVAGKMEGVCRIDSIYAGRSYDGHCKNDLPEGYGTLTQKDGRNYTGLFEKGVPAGANK